MKIILKRIFIILLIISLCLSSFVYIKYNNSNESNIIHLNNQDITIDTENDTIAINYEVQKKRKINDLLEFAKERYEIIKDNPLYENKSISFQFKDKYSRIVNLGSVIYKYTGNNEREMINNLIEIDWSKRPSAREFDIANVLNDVYNENKDNSEYTREQLYKDVSLKLNENIITVMDAGTKVSAWEWGNLINE